jgi:hypothetical protein
VIVLILLIEVVCHTWLAYLEVIHVVIPGLNCCEGTRIDGEQQACKFFNEKLIWVH